MDDNVIIWKKPSSKSISFDTCPLAENTAEVNVDRGTVEVKFTSGTVNKSSDFIIELDARAFAKHCNEAVSIDKPRALADYTEEELYAALKAKHINGG